MLLTQKAGALGLMALAIVLFASIIGAGYVYAAPGDQLAPPGPILPANGCGENNGVGVAFDGSKVLFTCADEAAIRMTDTSGANLGSLATADAAGAAVALDAIAWDPNENVLWGGNTDGADNQCHIFSVDMTTGVATERFVFSATNCDVLFFDGITVDPNTDTLYLSPDVSTNIFHKNKDGTAAANGTIDFSALTTGECPALGAGCLNSGLAIGLDGNLFAGTNGQGKIYRLNPDTPASLGVFTTVTGRDEDLECGPLVNGFESILSRDYETGRIDVLEAPDGTCVITEISLDPGAAENDFTVDQDHTVTATVTANGQPLAAVPVQFTITAGPNVGEQSDPSECTTDVNCNTDAAGQTSWSYTSAGLGVDTIEACYTTTAGTRHCATATKSWRDLTAPTLSCAETVNPHGTTTPPAGSTTLPGSKGGQNEDGFYELTGSDALDPNLEIWVSDSLGSGPFGAFASGDKVKITESPGATPSSKKMGSDNGEAGAIAAHITLNGDAIITATDAAGNTTEVACLVPPPPK